MFYSFFLLFPSLWFLSVEFFFLFFLLVCSFYLLEKLFKYVSFGNLHVLWSLFLWKLSCFPFLVFLSPPPSFLLSCFFWFSLSLFCWLFFTLRSFIFIPPFFLSCPSSDDFSSPFFLAFLFYLLEKLFKVKSVSFLK